MTVVILALFGGYASWIDAHEMHIPDRLVAIALITALMMSIGNVRPPWPIERLEGILFAWGQMHLARVLTRNRMGLGDVKFSAALGGIIGFRAWIDASITASILALAVLLADSAKERRLQHGPIPFAPFLSVGAMIGWFIAGGR